MRTVPTQPVAVKSAALVPDSGVPVMINGAVPELVTVIVCAADTERTAVVASASEVADSETAGAAAATAPGDGRFTKALQFLLASMCRAEPQVLDVPQRVGDTVTLRERRAGGDRREVGNRDTSVAIEGDRVRRRNVGRVDDLAGVERGVAVRRRSRQRRRRRSGGERAVATRLTLGVVPIGSLLVPRISRTGDQLTRVHLAREHSRLQRRGRQPRRCRKLPDRCWCSIRSVEPISVAVPSGVGRAR